MIGIEKERRNIALALGDRCFISRYNNQLIVGGSDGSYYGEDARPGRSIWGGVVSLLGAAN
jgi:hypothetical protein